MTPPSSSPDLSLAIPFYNEEACAERSIRHLAGVLERAGIHYELVLVNNGSQDRTAAILAEQSRKNPALRVVEVPQNQGYGWGIIQGLREARGTHVGYMCADEQIDPNDVVRVFQELRAGECDLAKVRRTTRYDGWKRRLIGLAFNRLFGLLFGARVRDINGTPKIFHRRHLEPFALTSKDWFIDAELVIKAGRENLRIREVPVVFHARKGGQSNVRWRTIVEFLRNLVRFRLGL